jgi:hypothetical protein
MVNNVIVEEPKHNVIVEDGLVRVVAVTEQGPAGPQGPPGDLDEEQLQAIVDDTVDAHSAETTDVHGIPDTSVLATQDDLENLDVLPGPGDDGDVLTLADGSPTWAAPEGGGG